MPESSRLQQAIQEYLSYVESCPERRSVALDALGRMLRCARGLNSCDVAGLGGFVSDLVRLNLQVQFDAEEYNRAHQYGTEIKLAHAITPELQRFQKMQQQQNRLLFQQRPSEFGGTSVQLEGFLHQKAAGVDARRLEEMQRQQEEQNARARARQMELDKVLLKTQEKVAEMQQAQTKDLAHMQDTLQAALRQSQRERDELKLVLERYKTQLEQQQTLLASQHNLIGNLETKLRQIAQETTSNANKLATLYTTTSQLADITTKEENDIVRIYQEIETRRQEYDIMAQKFDTLQQQYESMQLSIVQSQTNEAVRDAHLSQSVKSLARSIRIPQSPRVSLRAGALGQEDIQPRSSEPKSSDAAGAAQPSADVILDPKPAKPVHSSPKQGAPDDALVQTLPPKSAKQQDMTISEFFTASKPDFAAVGLAGPEPGHSGASTASDRSERRRLNRQDRQNRYSDAQQDSADGDVSDISERRKRRQRDLALQ